MRVLLFVLCACVVSVASTAWAAEPAPYMLRLADRAEAWRAELPALRASADEAAKHVLAGGRLLAAGPQKSFPAEACGRSGGLMLTRGYDPRAALAADDTVLAAVNGFETDDDLAKLDDLLAAADAAGARVVLFGPVDRARVGGHACVRFAASKPFGDSTTPADQMSIASLSNIIGLWAWTGQFIAACVDAGKMPCVYESMSMPGGKERIEALRGQTFHPTTHVKPAPAARLAGQYLDTIRDRLKQCWIMNQNAFTQAGKLIDEARQAGRPICMRGQAHMIPLEMQNPQSPAWIASMWRYGKNDKPLEPDSLVIELDYQAFPWQAWMGESKQMFGWILTCSHQPPAEFDAPNHVYIDPCWAIMDAAVTLPGYDARMLPISGVMQSAIYWQLVQNAGQRFR